MIQESELQDLAKSVVEILKKRKETLAVAESCTGGMLAQWISAVAGASEVFRGGLVSYQDEIKKKLLHIQEADLEKHTAVSPQVALQMAQNVKELFSSTWAISVTGLAGPGGGTPPIPVGTVYIGLATPSHTSVEKKYWVGDRHTIRVYSTQEALLMLLKKWNMEETLALQI